MKSANTNPTLLLTIVSSTNRRLNEMFRHAFMLNRPAQSVP
jgi:hypothetical protein